VRQTWSISRKRIYYIPFIL